jgi:hypothetical protein
MHLHDAPFLGLAVSIIVLMLVRGNLVGPHSPVHKALLRPASIFAVSDDKKPGGS